MKMKVEGIYGRRRSTTSRATLFTLTSAGLVLAAAVLFAAPGTGQSVDREAADPPERQSEPSWSPDGTRIAFRGGSFPDVDIWLADADGSDPVRVIDHPAADGYPVWSPDGSRLAFVSNRDGVWKLYVMDADGSNLRELASTSERDADPARPAWTPDGGTVLFVTIRDGMTGPSQLRLMDADGSNDRPFFGSGS